MILFLFIFLGGGEAMFGQGFGNFLFYFLK